MDNDKALVRPFGPVWQEGLMKLLREKGMLVLSLDDLTTHFEPIPPLPEQAIFSLSEKPSDEDVTIPQ